MAQVKLRTKSYFNFARLPGSGPDEALDHTRLIVIRHRTQTEYSTEAENP